MLQSFLHDRFVRIPSSDFGDEVIFPHDTLYLLVIHAWEPHFGASPAEFAFALVEDRFDHEVVFVVSVRLVGMREPLVISASRDMRQIAENINIVP